MAIKLSITSVGSNCNMKYFSNLRAFGCHPGEILFDAFAIQKASTNGLYRFGEGPIEYVYQKPNWAITLFAQGSEDSIKTSPYAPKLMEYILEHKLGEVWDSGPAPNALHGNKPGRSYMWKIDKTALKKWWEKYNEEKKS